MGGKCEIPGCKNAPYLSTFRVCNPCYEKFALAVAQSGRALLALWISTQQESDPIHLSAAVDKILGGE